MVDPGASGARRAVGAAFAAHAGAPEGAGRRRQARSEAGRALPAAAHVRGLALGNTAEPGAGADRGHRAPPILVTSVRWHGCVAAQRLLAGYVLGGDRRRR